MVFRTSLVRYSIHAAFSYIQIIYRTQAHTANLIPNNRLEIRRFVYQPLPHHIHPVINVKVRLSIPICLHILLQCLQCRGQNTPRQLMIVGIDSLHRDAVDAHPVEVASRQDLIPMLLDGMQDEAVASVNDVDDGHRIHAGAGIHDDEGLAAAGAPEHAGIVAAGAER